MCERAEIIDPGVAMGGDDKDGYYWTICGGIPPDQIKIKKIPVDGKETGIDRLDWILLDVASLNLTNDETITNEIIKRVRQFNYIPAKKMTEYRRALLRKYKMTGPGEDKPQKKQETLHA